MLFGIGGFDIFDFLCVFIFVIQQGNCFVCFCCWQGDNYFYVVVKGMVYFMLVDVIGGLQLVEDGWLLSGGFIDDCLGVIWQYVWNVFLEVVVGQVGNSVDVNVGDQIKY